MIMAGIRKNGQVLLWWIALGVLVSACYSTALAQSTERSLKVWVDTINLNVCEGRGFDSLGVWLESFVWSEEEDESDGYVGFRTQDSILAFTLTLQWDTSRIRLQPPYILTPPQSLFGRFPTKTQSVDTTAGTLYVSVAANENLRIVIGRDIPLFYLKGRVRAEDTIDMPEGGARVQFVDIEGKLGDNLGTVDFLPGFVRVIRDTTPEYTGSLRVTKGMLDTNRRDTVFAVADNLSDKRVREVRFAFKADTNAFMFIDTVEAGTLASTMTWTERQIDVRADSIFGRFVADADLTMADSVLIGIIIERTTDSGFSAGLEVTDFGINVASCLGKLRTFSATVEAEKIPEKEDTTTTSVWAAEISEEEGAIAVRQSAGGGLLIVTGMGVEEIVLFDLSGRMVQRWSGTDRIDNGISIPPHMPGGRYFLAIRDKNRRIWYKQIFIQTN